MSEAGKYIILMLILIKYYIGLGNKNYITSFKIKYNASISADKLALNVLYFYDFYHN